MTGGKYQPLTLTPINFSLTEGTSIPAPLDSPPDTPRPPTPGKGPLSSHPTPNSATFPPSADSPPPKESTDSTADSHLQKTVTSDGTSSTLSPTSPSSKRPSSVRKFLGLRTLSSSDSLKSDRPGSPATVDSKPSLSRKKSGSWFGKRKSTMMFGSVPEGKENAAPQTNGKPGRKGPPPPALPELKTFGVSDEAVSLGAEDLFKNIK
ncbi:uncharacterized protein BDR25DRAFT_302121 [Lindgomyces ingoldianus]|uniref:Uncharacterized protein n=1 Tax=Lindgomyces ingoldianus TaxID=673940 RepID=A0ACB6R1I0_9PLEO|nr:uncharacterized protein BDR25DRAFT_302121 [Lindgomyces ingoldianus]KAF2473114.1 hypothetical protein BDR25DRAFT_302121 [Lindgomyces ingoldianus]